MTNTKLKSSSKDAYTSIYNKIQQKGYTLNEVANYTPSDFEKNLGYKGFDDKGKPSGKYRSFQALLRHEYLQQAVNDNIKSKRIQSIIKPIPKKEIKEYIPKPTYTVKGVSYSQAIQKGIQKQKAKEKPKTKSIQNIPVETKIVRDTKSVKLKKQYKIKDYQKYSITKRVKTPTDNLHRNSKTNELKVLTEKQMKDKKIMKDYIPLSDSEKQSIVVNNIDIMTNKILQNKTNKVLNDANNFHSGNIRVELKLNEPIIDKNGKVIGHEPNKKVYDISIPISKNRKDIIRALTEQYGNLDKFINKLKEYKVQAKIVNVLLDYNVYEPLANLP